MNITWQDFHFLRPVFLWLGLLLPLLAWLTARGGRAPGAWQRVVDASLLPSLLAGQKAKRGKVLALVLAGWTLAVLALAGPTWNRSAQPLFASQAGQVVAISLSSHMLMRDVVPSRLDQARYKAQVLLHGNHDGFNALLAYAGESYVVAPLTSDAGSLNALLAALSPDEMPVDGDDAAAAIHQAMELLEQAKVKQGSIVLITDTVDAAAQAASREAQQAGMRVSVLGIGAAKPSPAPDPHGGFQHDEQGQLMVSQRDDAALKALAEAGGGVYRAATADDRDLAALHAVLHHAAPARQKSVHGDLWEDRGPWLLLPLLLMAACGFRRGWLVLPFVLWPLWPAPAQAMEWRDLWLRPDQQAALALHAGHAAEAAKLAQDPAWRGAAAYKAGDYAAAQQALTLLTSSDGAYNLGNALAKQQRYQEAIEAYTQAIKRNPHNSDAIANRKAVEDWLRRQQQPPSKQQAQNKSKDSKSKDSKQNSRNKQDSRDKSPSSAGQSSKDSSSGQGGQSKPSSQPSSGQQNALSKDLRGPPGKDQNPHGRNPLPSSAQNQDQGRAADPQQTAAQRARQTAQAQQALKQQMDQALAGQAGKRQLQPADQPHQLGADDGALPTLPADIKQQLLRVPDNPGSLLQRKFLLEYQRRHGGVDGADDKGGGAP